MSEASFGKQNLRELAFETIEHEFGYLRSSLGTPEILKRGCYERGNYRTKRSGVYLTSQNLILLWKVTSIRGNNLPTILPMLYILIKENHLKTSLNLYEW